MRCKPGTVPPIIYFVNRADPRWPEGHIMLSPCTDPNVFDYPTPEGYERREAYTLAMADELQDRLIEQEYRQRAAEFRADESRYHAFREDVRARLYARMTSSETTPFERDFIREYLKLRDGEKRKKYQQRFLEATCFLHVCAMDSHGRDEAREEFNAERHG